MQLTHYNTRFNQKTFPITIVCDTISSAANIGSLFRIADAFGVAQIIFCGKNFELGKRFKKTSRSTENYINYTIETDIIQVLNALKSTNHLCIALEITDNSKAITATTFTTKQPIALVIGNENFGVSQSVLKQVNLKVHIPMYGKNSSMNVVQATNIVLYEITKQLNI